MLPINNAVFHLASKPPNARTLRCANVVSVPLQRGVRWSRVFLSPYALGHKDVWLAQPIGIRHHPDNDEPQPLVKLIGMTSQFLIFAR